MSTDEDEEIPVLTEAVRRRGRDLSGEQIDEICDSLAAEAWVMLDNLIAESLRDIEEELRIKINDRLGDELPQLIEKTLHEKLGEPPAD
ncbi:MAG: hypothetical protein HKN56_11225 [Gammaproteobacteria bacterium]|nr:hypothetical protein [Gammaproteobacteria bacterium]